MNRITPVLAFAWTLLSLPQIADAQAEGAKAPDAKAGDSQAADAKNAQTFSTEQIEQMVAPIALHPDELLAQILMASTYPLEIVEASRWVEKNPKLTGKNLEEALKKQDWDASVKSMCGFPTVLKQMNEDLDWMQDLGDAFLAQKKELFDAVQRMRQKAKEAGNLKTTEQQKVAQDGDIIIIESANPEVIYVPTYSPTVVYGGWYYPSWYYPPLYAPPPAGYGFVAFSIGVAWGAAIWGDCDWNNGDVDIDIDKNNNFNRNTEINFDRNRPETKPGGKGEWKHNPEHRKGVNYKSSEVKKKYGDASASSRVSRDQARGYDRSAASTKAPTAGIGKGSTPTPTPSTRAAGSRPSSSQGTPSVNKANRGSAYSGSRSPSLDRSASSRGAASRGGGGGGGRGGRGGGGRGR